MVYRNNYPPKHIASLVAIVLILTVVHAGAKDAAGINEDHRIAVISPAFAGEEAEVRSTLQRTFNQLKNGEYGSLYDSLPSSFRSRMSRDRFTSGLERSRNSYRLERMDIGRITVAGDLAAADTTMYAHISQPLDSDGKLVVQQYLIKENGSWKVATGDRATIDRFLKNNPTFARKFPIRQPRTYLKQNGAWVEIPFNAGRRSSRPD
jgi:hypothetical protein